MTPEDFHQVAENFETYYNRFTNLFPHPSVRQTARSYLQGLLLDGERKNGSHIAQATGMSSDAIQRLLNKAKWDADAVRDALQRWIVETANVNDNEHSQNAIVTIGETTFPKRGQNSVCVHRHTNSLTNKRENGQVGLFMSYDPRGQHRPILCDRRLFLPQEWCTDIDRRKQTSIPGEVQFQDKSMLALEMLEHAWKMGIPMEWVVGDSVCGDAPFIRDAVAAQGYQYLFAASPETPVWLEKQTDAEPSTVATIVKETPTNQWKQGLLGQDAWLDLQVLDCREGNPGLGTRLLAQRRPEQVQEMTYYLSNAPASSSLIQVAQMASSRATVHHCLEVARCEVGLADYETRYWHGWYRHITLAMVAAAWHQTDYIQSARRADLKRWLAERSMEIADLVKNARQVNVKFDKNHLAAVLKGKRPFSDTLAEKLAEVGVELGF